MLDIDTYLNSLSPNTKKALQHVRRLIHVYVPESKESFSYGMPAFTYKEKPLIYFAAFKDHLSIFPTALPIKTLESELQTFKVSKGTIQFTIQEPLPDSLLKKLLYIRKSEIEKETNA